MDALWCRRLGRYSSIVSFMTLLDRDVVSRGPYRLLIVSDSVARVRRLGIRNLQVDDYLMMFAVVWYTILCVALNSVATGGGSNLMTDDDIKNLTPATHAERERGSKWVFVSEHAFILCVWSLKACMLVIYSRITYVGLRRLISLSVSLY